MNTADLPKLPAIPRLTSLSHGGGCGCKIAPGVLSEILKNSGNLPGFNLQPQLLVGIETADDAAVYQLNDEQALIATTDFFMPIVDDPYDFGRIAATNAISDVYAMGGTPIMALGLVGMPINVLPLETIGAILRGGRDVCNDAGIPVARRVALDGERVVLVEGGDPQIADQPQLPAFGRFGIGSGSRSAYVELRTEDSTRNLRNSLGR